MSSALPKAAKDDALPRRAGGNYRERKEDPDNINFKDFENPWTFYGLLLRGEVYVVDWCRKNDLLATNIVCDAKVKTGTNLVSQTCGGLMTVKPRSNRIGNETFRCDKNRNHERPSRKYSFFENSHLTLNDIMVFVKSYLDGCTLKQCASFAGISYGSSAVNWAHFIRELFMEHFQRNVRKKRLNGVIEIDESLFGRRVKYHRGNPHVGIKIWVFGMVERATNTLILYPVADRTADTLIPLIERHVEKGSAIYSDGWSAYCDLNKFGYNHFSVVHKYAFKKVYVNTKTGEKVTVNTNRMEGAWKHAKDYFKRMAGTKGAQFESHMAEVIWRSEVKERLYEKFFELLKSIYVLTGPPEFSFNTPLFDSWDGVEPEAQTNKAIIEPEVSDAESDTEEVTLQPPLSVAGSSGLIKQKPRRRRRLPSSRAQYINEFLADKLSSASLSSEEDEDVKKTTTLLPAIAGSSNVSKPRRTIDRPEKSSKSSEDEVVKIKRAIASPVKSKQLLKSRRTVDRPTETSPVKSKQLSKSRRTVNRPVKLTRSSSDSEDEIVKTKRTIASPPKPLSNISMTFKSNGKTKSLPSGRTINTYHPIGFVEEKSDRPRRQRKAAIANPYSREAFIWNIRSVSDDSNEE